MEEVYINGKKVLLTQSVSDLMISDEVRKKTLEITLDVMNNCIDVIYELVKASHPNVYRPALYLSNDEAVNAYADHNKRRIIINLGLILGAVPMISRYQKEILDKYHILQDREAVSVQSGVRVHLWRFVILHELYHLWNGHSQWKMKYWVNENGEILIRTPNSPTTYLIPPILSEANQPQDNQSNSKVILENTITDQAIELDADSSAVCMLINLLFYDMNNRRIADHLQNNYIKEHLAYIMAALSSAFCLFDSNSGGKFELLNKLENFKHPIPAIRFVYAEEIADACLQQYIKEETDLSYVESEWQKIVCDVEAEYKGDVDMGQVFFYPAYTEIAQKHLCKVKRRLTDMHDTLQEFAIGNTATKLSEEDLEFDPNAVWFDEKGKSLKGWINPATGKNVAIRSDKMPITVGQKTGRNDLCPCGSGNKFKRCCIGKGIYD